MGAGASTKKRNVLKINTADSGSSSSSLPILSKELKSPKFGKPLMHLASFALASDVSCTIECTSCGVDKAGTFTVVGPPAVVNACASLRISGSGKLSPIHPITLTPEWKMREQIPLAATQFAFIYPMQGTQMMTDAMLWSIRQVERAVQASGGATQDVTDRLLATDEELPRKLELAYALLETMEEGDWSLLCFGGFGYFDAAGQILQINAISTGDSLSFEGPYMLPQSAVEQLERQGRLDATTLQPLLETGASRFAWICPGERSFTGNGEGAAEEELSCAVDHGAFAYYYPDSTLCRYFSVVAGSQISMMGGKHSPTLQVASV